MSELPRILVVEDEPNMRELVKERLEQNGYEVATAEDGYKAIIMAREFVPNLVILDLMLPKLDGFTVCGILKSSMDSSVPIILFTARSSPDDERRGRDLGANAYVTKPFEPAVLLGKIKELLSPEKPTEAAAQPEPAAQAEQPAEAPAQPEPAKPQPPEAASQPSAEPAAQAEKSAETPARTEPAPSEAAFDWSTQVKPPELEESAETPARAEPAKPEAPAERRAKARPPESAPPSETVAEPEPHPETAAQATQPAEPEQEQPKQAGFLKRLLNRLFGKKPKEPESGKD